MVTDDDMDRALDRLANTDQVAAELRTQVERCAFKAKKVKAMMFLHAVGTVAEREAISAESDEYEAAMTAYFKALLKSDELDNERKTKALIIDVYRTLSANRRQGHV